MLLLAGLPISPSRGERELITASAIGVVSALGILFKALEGALISLVANFLCKRSKPEVAACLVAFAVLVLLTCIMFSSSFRSLFTEAILDLRPRRDILRPGYFSLLKLLYFT